MGLGFFDCPGALGELPNPGVIPAKDYGDFKVIPLYLLACVHMRPPPLASEMVFLFPFDKHGKNESYLKITQLP